MSNEIFEAEGREESRGGLCLFSQYGKAGREGQSWPFGIVSDGELGTNGAVATPRSDLKDGRICCEPNLNDAVVPMINPLGFMFPLPNTNFGFSNAVACSVTSIHL